MIPVAVWSLRAQCASHRNRELAHRAEWNYAGSVKARAGIGCFALVVLTIGGYIGAHFRDPEPPRWSEVDVPLPANDGNGWSLIQRATIDLVPDDAREQVLRPLDEATDPDEPWDGFEQRVAMLRPSMIESSAALREAIAQEPRFFDGCPLHFDITCSLVELLEVWNHYQVAVLLNNDVALVGEMWERGRDFTSTCRTIVGCILGIQLLKRTLRVARWLVHKRVDGIGTLELPALDLPREHFQRAIIGDYIEKYPLFLNDDVPFLTDRAQTLRFLARDYEEIYAYAARDGTARPPSRHYTSGALSWVYNREGKNLLEMLETIDTLAEYVERYWEEVDEVTRDREELLQSIQ